MLAHRRLLRAAVALGATVATIVGLVAVPSASARANRAPYGGVRMMYRQGYGVVIVGWAVDPDTKSPAVVHIRLDNKRAATTTANLTRRWVSPRHPNRAFSVRVPLSSGTHEVCARVQGYPDKWRNYTIACKTLTWTYNPEGDLTSLTQAPGTLTATGWGVDFDNPHAVVNYTVLLDGRRVAGGPADQPFAGLSKLHPMTDDDHGFTATFPVAEGTHNVCLRISNLGQGSDTTVKCFSGRKVNYSPTGAVTSLAQAPNGAVTLAGYAVDPDTTSPTSVAVYANGGNYLGSLKANGAGGKQPGHAFSGTLKFPATDAGKRKVCVTARNLGSFGHNQSLGCTTRMFNWNPSAGLERAAQQGSQVVVSGWTTDPDTTAPIHAQVLLDGKLVTTVLANGASGSHPGYMFSTPIAVAGGKHTVCVVGVNTGAGTANSPQSCKTVTMNLDPYGGFESAGRPNGGPDIVATGWAIDPETTNPIKVQVSVDGTVTTATANIARPDIANAHPGTGTNHGFSVDIPEPTTDGEHNVCVSAVNFGGGTNPTVPLGCKIVIAVHPTPPSAPSNVTAVGGYGGAQITWKPSASDGGAPWTGYRVQTLPSGPSVTVAPGVLSATVTGLQPNTKYSFSVVATNVAGSSTAATSPTVTTQKAPPPQTSPAPISTSRYIRNISGGSAADLNRLHAEGAADARANPSGHGYLIVLAVGGQDESRHGVILTAGIRFVSYGDIVKNLKAYVDGYAGSQRPSAPLTLAIATNNDIDVYKASGASFANNIVDPVQSYARRYPGITIAGSDDMEPGFRAGYNATKSWLQGYLSATSAPFVFTGSADGCAWTRTNGSCNNGWTMSGLYYLTAGAYPVRMINLPQIYNNTMAAQWRYISLTGVQAGRPRIDFGGALTEWTACQQARSCGSLTGNNAWRAMWAQLRAEPALRPNSLPYSTDLRIDS